MLGALALSQNPLMASTVQVEVRLDLRAGLREVPEGAELVATSTEGSQQSWRLQGQILLQLPLDENWQLTCLAPDLWCPRLELKAADGLPTPRSVSLPVYRGVVMRGIVREPTGAQAPEVGVVQGSIWGAGEPAGIQLLEQLTAIEGAFSFQVPAAALDLRFSFAGWAPIYRWRLEIEPSEAGFDLGSLRLFRGASVAGWVRDEESDLPVPRATVILAPMASDWAPKAGDLFHEALSDLHGFFQVRGVAPGRYRLEIASSDSATLVLDELEVATDSETMLGALQLTPPLRALVQVDPLVDPSGEQWSLRFRPVRPLPDEQAIEAVVGEDGAVEVHGLRPAEYFVQVLTSSGDALVAEERHIELDRVLELIVPVIGIHGVVLLDEEPVQAQIVLKTGAGDAMELASDADGEFRGFVRRPRWPWLLATVSWSDGGEEKSRELELPLEIPERGEIEIEIEIPNQNVSGVVVDGDGEPVKDARVTASPARPSPAEVARENTDKDGRFRIAGLSEERYHLRAKRAGYGASEVSSVDLDSGSGGEVRLVLLPSRVVEGRVQTSEGAGIAGAYLDFETRGQSPVSISAITDWEGGFSVELPVDAEDAVVEVFAPTQLLWSECVRLDVEAGELVIRMPPLPGGTLLLEIRGQPDQPPATGGRPYVISERGGIFGMGVLHSWGRRMKGDMTDDSSAGIYTVTVPAVAPGNYSLTWSRTQIWELAGAACSGAFFGLQNETLVSGGQATLRLDVGKYQKRAKTSTE